jgi:hypothetical protein
MMPPFGRQTLLGEHFVKQVPRVNNSTVTSNVQTNDSVPASLNPAAEEFFPSSLNHKAEEFFPATFPASTPLRADAPIFYPANFLLSQDATPRASEPAVVASPQLSGLSQD